MADIELDELYVWAARKLKVVQVNEPLSAEDRKVFADYYPPLYAMLEGRGWAMWPEEGPIPERYALQVRELLAEQAAQDFGKDFVSPWAMLELSRQAKPDYTYDETRFMDF